ncbi:transmembrane protein 186-like isoform X2 [Hoplias malabaricus]|uniref:transmembrane protein 186-like isoform X2 n=1 Tax=Hoplias malabaricus TaxID=27720 RepID=UPI003462FCA5
MQRSQRFLKLTYSLVASGPQCPHPCQGVHRFQYFGTKCLTSKSSIKLKHITFLTSSSTPKNWSHGLLQYHAQSSSSDLASQNYSLIYAFPAIKGLRALSRLKLMQTGITAALLPTVFFFYLQGQASITLLTYTTGIATFAAVMLYVISYYIRRVVGMMYLDSTHTKLKVSHLSFWGHRRDIYLPVSDVMTLGDTGDSPGESILQLKRYSCSDTFYFSPRLGLVVDKHSFEKVFGTLPQ